MEFCHLFRFFPAPHSTKRILRNLNRDIAKTRRPSDAEITELCMLRERKPPGESLRRLLESERRLVHQNIRLVQYLAGRLRYDGLISYLDLFQQGVLGLIIAAENWQPELGTFGPYAGKCIRKMMVAELIKANVGSIVYVPAHIRQLYVRLNKAQQTLRDKNRQEPSTAEISTSTKNDETVVTQTLANLNGIVRINSSSLHQTSTFMNKELMKEACDETMAVDVIVDHHIILKKIFVAFEQDLTDQQRTVLCYRFGFNGHEVKTLVAIGAILGVDGIRARRIEQTALRLLRNSVTNQGHFYNEFYDWL